MKTIKLLAVGCLLTVISCSEQNSSSTLQSHAELYNTQWMFKAFEVIGDTLEVLPPNQQYLIAFKHRMEGVTDSECVNGYDGMYAVRPPSGIAIGEIRSTRAACRDSYWRYLDHLKQSRSYEILGDMLYLWSLDRSRRLVFVRIHE